MTDIIATFHLNNEEYQVYINEQDFSAPPHFHIKHSDYYRGYHTSISLETADYCFHECKNSDEFGKSLLSAEELSAMADALNEKFGNRGFTLWQRMLRMWNKYNDHILIDEKVEMPNYLDISAENIFKTSDFAIYNGSLIAARPDIVKADIGDTVTSIHDYAFINCKNLVEVNIPESVTEIRWGAFKYCDALKRVNIPDSVLEIDCRAFDSCVSLKSIKLPNKIRNISYCLFDNCSSLTNITIPPSVEHIESRAFRSCTSLINIDLKNSNCKISACSFDWCSNLKSLHIHSGVTISDWGDSYHYHPQNINSKTKITVDEDHPLYKTEGNLIISRDGKRVIRYQNSGVQKSCSLPVGVETILPSAFNNSNLEEIILPETVREIGSGAFSGCHKLKRIEIPSGVTEICYATFADCYSLSEVVLPDTIRRIEDFAFNSCKSLASINIPSGVKNICDAFNYCTSLTEIDLPDSVTYISDHTFTNCRSLWRVKLPKSLQRLEEATFSDCTALREITMPKSLQFIGERAFCKCNSLSEITIPKSVNLIDVHIFYECRHLRRVFVPEHLETAMRMQLRGFNKVEVVRC